MLLNVCLVAEEYPVETGWGGIGTYHYTLAHGLADIGCNVHVVARGLKRNSTHNDGKITIHRILPVKTEDIFLDHSIGYRLAVLKQIIKLKKQYDIDIIESPEWNAETFFIKFLNLDIPIVLRMHSTLPVISYFNKVDVYSNVDKLQLYFEKWLINNADYVYSSSLALVREAKKHYQIARKINVFRNPANNFHFKPIAGFKKNSSKLIILYVGRIEKRKGVDIIFNAIPKIIDMYTNVEFHFIGRDTIIASTGISFKDELISKIDKSYLNNITFYGYVEYLTLVSHYNKADICVFPSWFENYPAVCLEAMSCGKAVLGSSNGGISEILKNNKTGLLFDPFKDGDFETKLLMLIKNPTLMITLGRNARKEIDKKFDRYKVAKSIHAIYEKAIYEYRNK